MKRLALVALCLLVEACAPDEAGRGQPRIPNPFLLPEIDQQRSERPHDDPPDVLVPGVPSSLDTTFEVSAQPRDLYDVRDLVELPTGKLLITGEDSEATPVVCRLNSNGTPDASFGTSLGCVHVDVGARATGIALMLDGDRLLISGTSVDEFFVARISVATGALDPSFGTGGATRLPHQQEGWLYSMEVAGGEIYLAGGEREDGVIRAFAVRLDYESGLLDLDFGTNGWIRFGDRMAFDLLRSSERIVATTGTRLWGFDLSGVPDSSFGENGSRELPWSTATLALDHEGKILAAGAGMAAVRLSPAGAILESYSALDPGEDWSGIPMRAEAVDLVLEDDGTMVFAGSLTTDMYWLGVGRRLPNGEADPTFGVGGARAFESGSIARRVKVLRDGRYALVGTAWHNSGVVLRVWN